MLFSHAGTDFRYFVCVCVFCFLILFPAVLVSQLLGRLFHLGARMPLVLTRTTALSVSVGSRTAAGRVRRRPKHRCLENQSMMGRDLVGSPR